MCCFITVQSTFLLSFQKYRLGFHLSPCVFNDSLSFKHSCFFVCLFICCWSLSSKKDFLGHSAWSSLRLGSSALHPLKILDLQSHKIWVFQVFSLWTGVFDPSPSQDGEDPWRILTLPSPSTGTISSRVCAQTWVFAREEAKWKKVPPEQFVSLEPSVGLILSQFRFFTNQEERGSRWF